MRPFCYKGLFSPTTTKPNFYKALQSPTTSANYLRQLHQPCKALLLQGPTMILPFCPHSCHSKCVKEGAGASTGN
eukprot:1094889-Pelagomonas_calceolata.AAC.8